MRKELAFHNCTTAAAECVYIWRTRIDFSIGSSFITSWEFNFNRVEICGLLTWVCVWWRILTLSYENRTEVWDLTNVRLYCSGHVSTLKIERCYAVNTYWHSYGDMSTVVKSAYPRILAGIVCTLHQRGPEFISQISINFSVAGNCGQI